MNELNLERCRCIPKLTPGADWRVLQEIIEQHPERTLYKVRCTATHRFYAWCPLLAYFAETTYFAAACRLDIPDLIGMIPQNDTLSCSHINGTYVRDAPLAGLRNHYLRDMPGIMRHTAAGVLHKSGEWLSKKKVFRQLKVMCWCVAGPTSSALVPAKYS